MPLSLKTLEKRAVKAGVKASKKSHHLVSPAELMALRVQVMSPYLRGFLLLLGLALIVCGWFGWPTSSPVACGIEAVSGFIAVLFGAFGIRRTLSNVLDSLDALEVGETILEMIGEAVSSLDL